MQHLGEIKSVNIRPGVAILSVLQHLNYRPWFAMAEFVDNSVQSYLDHRPQLVSIDGDSSQLRVSIETDSVDGGRVTIRDNAAGIHESDYARAFRPAEMPLDSSGLCEFGMGMKSASCWFARKWSVRTSALGEAVERAVQFDVERIVHDSLEELAVQTRPVSSTTHFTEITLSGLHRPLQGRTLGKMKQHLASIYRQFIRRGILVLSFDGEVLSYTDPGVLHTPFYKNLTSGSTDWRKEINFDFGGGLRATGFAGLRDPASVSDAGFALFRRSRLIQGSSDEGYRPELIFGKPNSYTYQRLFGELELEGFEVSHTKDGFRWDDDEETFLQLLREYLNAAPLPLLDQAEGHRARQRPEDLRSAAETATAHTISVIEREVPAVLDRQIESQPESKSPPPVLPVAELLAKRYIDVDLHDEKWRIVLECTTDPSVGDWLTISDRPADDDAAAPPDRRRVGVRVALCHPFMERFGGTTVADMEPLLRIAAAIGLAETAARDAGARQAGTVRRNMNELLRDALSKP